MKARSRAVLAYPSQGNPPCDDNLWEEESCQTKECMTFQWSARPWGSSRQRVVLCRRSDGLVVEGEGMYVRLSLSSVLCVCVLLLLLLLLFLGGGRGGACTKSPQLPFDRKAFGQHPAVVYVLQTAL